MGAYLSKPITEKQTESGGNQRVRYAATSMQGWRINQEDAHNCIANFDDNCSLFAVYDGHGGSEVAQYSADHLPEMLKANSLWLSGDYVKAIENTFLEFDENLRSDSVMKELKKMAGTVAPKREESSDDDEDKEALYEEAAMPIETILQKYGIVFRRDRNGKQSLIDLEELRAEVEKQGAKEELKEVEQSEKKIKENDSNGMEQKTNGRDQNGDTMANKEAKEDGSQLKKQEEGKVVEEKTKKRLCESSPTSLSAKRTKSSQGYEDEDLVDHCMSSYVNSSVAGKSETNVAEERFETAGESEIPNSEPEAAGPAEVNTTATSNSSATGDGSVSSSEIPQASVTPDGQNVFSSDSEQSMDEDYNADEEMSEGEEDEENEDEDEDEDINESEPTYSCPSGETPGEDSGTTACVVILFKDKVIVGNAGDSRAVLCCGGIAIELSIDHKPEDDAERRRILAAGGEISMDGRVNGGLNLSRALGDHFYKKNNALPLKEQMISALPDVKEYKLTEEDEFIIIACDGIWNSLTSQEAVDFVRQRINDGVNLKDICEQICDHCLSPNTAGDGTGCDNMTIIVAQILHSTQSQHQQLQHQPASSS